MIASALEDFKATIMKGEDLTRLWNGLGFINDETGYGDRLLIGQLPIQGAVEVANGHVARHDHTVSVGLQTLDRPVELIVYLTDNFFDDVLKRDQAHQRAVLIDDQREVLAFLAERVELFKQIGGFGNKPGLARNLRDVDRIGVPRPPRPARG